MEFNSGFKGLSVNNGSEKLYKKLRLSVS